MSLDLMSIQKKLGHEFVNTNLFLTAITHRSYRVKMNNSLVQASNYERLEFLGDAVLELVITSYLYRNFEKNEGELTAIRSNLVNRHVLAIVGTELGLENVILLSDQERAEMGKARDSIVADAVEAVLGAVYLEAGIEKATEVVYSLFLPHLTTLLASNEIKDPKTELQEWTQRNYKVTPLYKTLETRGKDHQKEFECGMFLKTRLIARAWGKSKQEAQSLAAKESLELLKNESKTARLAALIQKSQAS